MQMRKLRLSVMLLKMEKPAGVVLLNEYLIHTPHILSLFMPHVFKVHYQFVFLRKQYWYLYSYYKKTVALGGKKLLG